MFYVDDDVLCVYIWWMLLYAGLVVRMLNDRIRWQFRSFTSHCVTSFRDRAGRMGIRLTVDCCWWSWWCWLMSCIAFSGFYSIHSHWQPRRSSQTIQNSIGGRYKMLNWIFIEKITHNDIFELEMEISLHNLIELDWSFNICTCKLYMLKHEYSITVAWCCCEGAKVTRKALEMMRHASHSEGSWDWGRGLWKWQSQIQNDVEFN